jgi:polyhydroxyalkanoate synthesis regulator phasin
MDLNRAFERESDELDRQLANGEIDRRQHKQFMDDLIADMRMAEDEERMKQTDAQREWEQWQ